MILRIDHDHVVSWPQEFKERYDFYDNNIIFIISVIVAVSSIKQWEITALLIKEPHRK